MPNEGFSPVRACRICGSSGIFPVLDLGEQPLANSLVPPGSPPPPTYPLAVVGCPGCGVMQLSGTVDPHRMFDDYLYFSSYSASMVATMGELALRTVDELKLSSEDLVVEIASNDGYLLRHYRDLGVRVLGIEPAANVAAVAQEAGIDSLVSYFTSELASQLKAGGSAPRVIHANNVLAHVPDIHDFVEGLHILVPHDGVVIIETPYLINLVDHGLFETIYHEHVFYYSLSALTSLFGQHDMEIVDCESIPVHGGSLRVTIAQRGHTEPTSRALDAAGSEPRLDQAGAYSSFITDVAASREEVIGQLRHIKESGKSLAGYGAAAKATVLLNFAGITSGTIDYVVDLNPVKQGKLIPGTGIRVVGPDELRHNTPDVLAVLVWNLAQEVRSQMEWYTAAGGELIVPLENRRGIDRRPADHPAAQGP